MPCYGRSRRKPARDSTLDYELSVISSVCFSAGGRLGLNARRTEGAERATGSSTPRPHWRPRSARACRSPGESVLRRMAYGAINGQAKHTPSSGAEAPRGLKPTLRCASTIHARLAATASSDDHVVERGIRHEADHCSVSALNLGDQLFRDSIRSRARFSFCWSSGGRGG
jgi:hypothetical protein